MAVRSAVIIGLVIASLLVEAVIAPEPSRTLKLPEVGSLIAGSGWKAYYAYQPKEGYVYLRQWRLIDGKGEEAQLYVGMSYRMTSALRWTGEAGYQAEGYVLESKFQRRLLGASPSATEFDSAIVRRYNDAEFLTYAIVGPNGVSALSQESIPGIVLALATTRGSPYYVVRVSVPGDQASRGADTLMMVVTKNLQALG